MPRHSCSLHLYPVVFCNHVNTSLSFLNCFNTCCVFLNIVHIFRNSGLATKLCPTLATSWTVALQAPLSMGFSRQEYWSGLPFPSPGDLPNPGMELAYSALGGGILYHWTSGKPLGWGELNSKNTHSSDKPADWWVSLKKGCNHVLPPPAFICQGRNHNVDTH